jgi:hypothetical protein
MYVTLGGVQLKPLLPITIEPIRAETLQRSKNNTLYRKQWGSTKKRWILTHDNLSEADLVVWLTRANLTTTQTYVDESGASFTVIAVGGLAYELIESKITSGSTGTATYSATLTIEEV